MIADMWEKWGRMGSPHMGKKGCCIFLVFFFFLAIKLSSQLEKATEATNGQ